MSLRRRAHRPACIRLIREIRIKLTREARLRCPYYRTVMQGQCSEGRVNVAWWLGQRATCSGRAQP
ncbi:hypothetical protein LC55x_2636 [Lysobacter capsici]|nr:hypothetical protein LC55x_2636 [Lysobacter capsici]